MILNREITACFTGRRPKDLWGYKPANNEYKILREITADRIEELYEKGCRQFLSGGAQGFDQVAFAAVIVVKKRHPEWDIKNIVCVPCHGQDSQWAEKGLFSKEEYRRMLSFADEVVYVKDRPYHGPKDLTDRNHYMVTYSGYCLALWDNELSDYKETMRSGTAECMRSADRCNTEIGMISPREVEEVVEKNKEEDKGEER